jgi:protein-S-isoprenylcysteine O-methyltransferase Ste14
MMSTLFWLLILLPAQLLVIVYPPVWAFWLIVHSNIARWRQTGARAVRFAPLVWPVIGGILALFWRDLFAVQWPSPQLLRLAGGIALIAGVRLFRAARRTISFKTLVGYPEFAPAKHPQPLLQTGIYARTRNPIYLAHMLFIFAAAAASGYAANWALLALDMVFLPLMVLAEERELLARYGEEYAAYMRRVPRFL